MNFKLTISLVIVLSLIASLFFFLNYKEKTAPVVDNTPKNALLSPAPKDITALGYLRDHVIQVSFEKVGTGENAKWKLTAPFTAPADTFAVENTAQQIKDLTHSEKFEPTPTGPKSEEATGLKLPKHIIEFIDDTGKKRTIALGKRTVGGIFARLDSAKTIYLLQSNPLERFEKDPRDFREKKLVENDRATIAAVAVTTDSQTVKLARLTSAEPSASQDKWTITAPVPTRANAQTIDALLGEIATIRAAEFTSLTPDLAALGLTPPLASITAYKSESVATSTAASAPAPKLTPLFTLNLGYFADPLKKDYVYASLAGSNEVFTLSTNTFNKLKKNLSELRDPAITPAPVAETSTLQTNNLSLNNADGKWTLSVSKTDSAIPASPQEIGLLLGNIQALRAIKFVDGPGNLAAIGLDPPVQKITLTLPNSPQQEVLLIGKPETADKVTPIMRQGEPTVFLVQTADVERITSALTPLALRDKDLERLNVDRIQSITFEGPATVAQTLTRGPNNWSIARGSASSSADPLKMTPFLAQFTPLSVGKWHATNRDLIKGKKPDITLTINLLEDVAATQPASTLPGTETAGPSAVRIATRTLQLFKLDSPEPQPAIWLATYSNDSQAWLFAPTPAFLESLSKPNLDAPATQPATQPASQPATQP